MRGAYNVSGGGGAPTIVNITEQRPNWLGQAVVVCLVFQTVALLLFGYLAFGPREEEPQRLASDEQKLLDLRERELSLKREVLDEVIKNISGEDEVAKKLEERTMKLDELERKLAIAEAGVPQLLEDRNELAAAADEYKAEAEGNKKDYQRVLAKYDESKKEIDLLKSAIKDGDAPDSWYANLLTGKWLAVGVVVLVFVGAAGFFAFRGMAAQDEFPEELLEGAPPPAEGNFASGKGAEEDQEATQEEVGFEDEPPRES
jgi:hypothetical protein